MDDRDCGTTLAKTDKFGFWSTNKDGIDAPKVERSVPAAQADKLSSFLDFGSVTPSQLGKISEMKLMLSLMKGCLGSLTFKC